MLKLIKYATRYYANPAGIAITGIVLGMPLIAKLASTLTLAPTDDIVPFIEMALFGFLLMGTVLIHSPLMYSGDGEDHPSLFLIPMPFLKIILAQLAASLPVWIVALTSFSTLSLLFQNEHYVLGLGRFTVLSLAQILLLTITYILSQLTGLFMYTPKGAVSEKFAQIALSIPFAKNLYEDDAARIGLLGATFVITIILVPALVLATKEFTSISNSTLSLLLIVLSAMLLYGNAKLMEKHVNF